MCQMVITLLKALGACGGDQRNETNVESLYVSLLQRKYKMQF